MNIIQFDKIYSELICENVPTKSSRTKTVDPWDGEKPHAKDGFVEKYCLDNEVSEE